MSAFRGFLGLWFWLLVGLLAAGPARAGEKEELVAQAAVRKWLALVDEGKLVESWQGAAKTFQAAVTQEQWQQSLKAVRQPLGTLVSRKLKSAKSTKTLPGAPDGEYVILQFDTVFTNKKEAIETITPTLEADGNWKVTGYYIK